MLKVLLYGLATFMETGIGVWIFGQMFPKRKLLEKKHYISKGVMYTLLFVGGYTLSCLFWGKNNVEKLRNCFIFLYISFGMIMCFYKRIKKNSRACGTFLFIAMVVWIEGQYWDMYQSITMIGLGNILPVLYLYLFYESTLLQAYIWEVFYLANIAIAKEVYIAYVGIFEQKKFVDFLHYPRSHSYSEIIYLIVLFCIMLIMNKIFEISKVMKNALCFNKSIVWGIGMLEIGILSVFIFSEDKIYESNLKGTLIIFGILIFLFLSLTMRYQKKMNDAQCEILNIRYETMQKQYEELNCAYNKYRCIIHDEKHLLSFLEECLENDKIEEALMFIKNFQNNNFNSDNLVWTGIPIVDFMLNIKYRKIEKYNIAFKVNADFENIPLEDSDVIMILGNLLDNAIEASMKSKKKEIKLYIANKNDMFILKVINTYEIEPVTKGERFISNKKEKNKHGWGIESVKEIVNKYEGMVDFKFHKNIFEANLMIEIK